MTAIFEGDAVLTRLCWAACFLLLTAVSLGQTTPEPRTSPGHKLMVSVKFVNAGQLSARQQEQIRQRLREEGANAGNEQEARDFSGWVDEAAERVRTAYQDDGYFKVRVAAELMPGPQS